MCDEELKKIEERIKSMNMTADEEATALQMLHNMCPTAVIEMTYDILRRSSSDIEAFGAISEVKALFGCKARLRLAQSSEDMPVYFNKLIDLQVQEQELLDKIDTLITDMANKHNWNAFNIAHVVCNYLYCQQESFLEEQKNADVKNREDIDAGAKNITFT